MTESQDKYWLAFASIEKVGSVFVKTLVDYFGSAKDAWCASADDLYEMGKLTKRQIADFLSSRKDVNPQECLDCIKNKNISYLTFDDEKYPNLLKEIHNPPMTLFYKGDLNRCNFDRTLAVVGSRKASQNAKTVLSGIISEFENTDICIVSGLALGIDTCAHKSAISSNLSTIGVIASGFDYVYPTQNRDLYKQIEEKNGVIFSEYWPTFQPLTWRFPHRNRIVTGLCKGTVVAEAAIKSGAIISANLCLEQNRELMCIPGLLTNPNTEGIYKLIKNGAAVVTCAEDILDNLGWEFKQSKTTSVKKEKSFVPDGLSEQEKVVFEIIATDSSTIDMIAQKTSIEYSELLVILTSLELSGFIAQTDGEKYISLVKV